MRFHLAGVGLTVPFGQLRLGIEQVHLAGAAMLKETNHGLGARPMVWLLPAEAGARRPHETRAPRGSGRPHPASGGAQKPALGPAQKRNSSVPATARAPSRCSADCTWW